MICKYFTRILAYNHFISSVHCTTDDTSGGIEKPGLALVFVLLVIRKLIGRCMDVYII